MSPNFKRWAKVEFTKNTGKQVLDIESKPRECVVTEVREREFFKEEVSNIDRPNEKETEKVYTECSNKRITGYLAENNLKECGEQKLFGMC